VKIGEEKELNPEGNRRPKTEDRKPKTKSPNHRWSRLFVLAGCPDKLSRSAGVSEVEARSRRNPALP